VQGHAHLQPRRLGRQPALRPHRSVHRIDSTGERGHRAVALTLLHRTHAARRRDGIIENLTMARHRRHHLVMAFLPQARRTFDVGQQERHRSGRKSKRAPVPHHSSIEQERPGHQRRVQLHARSVNSASAEYILQRS